MESDNVMEVPQQKEKWDLPSDSRSQKATGNKRKKKKMNSAKNLNSLTPKLFPQKNIKGRDHMKDAPPSIGHTNSEVFDFDEIAGNKEASALISDLVKCFTNNSSLPPEHLHHLNQTLYEKTVNVFLTALNSCVEKIYNNVLNSDYFKELSGKNTVVKKDASCQTDLSYGKS